MIDKKPCRLFPFRLRGGFSTSMASFSHRLTRGLILGVLLLLSGVFVWGLWQGGRHKKELVDHDVEPLEAEMKLRDMEYTEMREGRRRWTIKAEEVRYFQDENKTVLTVVHLVFFLSDGREVHLTSRRGVLYAGSKDIDLWDSVKVEAPDGYRLRTERASYRDEGEVIFADAPVQVWGPDLELKGSKWKYLLSERRAFLEGRVEAVFKGTVDGRGENEG